MHINTVKITIDFGLHKPSASLSFLIIKAFFLTYLHCFCVTFSEASIIVNISETSTGYRSNLSPLLIELTFCCKSSMNISIDNRYCNLFIHLGRPILPVNHNGATVYYPDHIWDRACTCYTREALVTQFPTWMSEHHYCSTAQSSYCSVNPLRLQ